jgi:type IX secretion system PorP/SprF family membrane protein
MKPIAMNRFLLLFTMLLVASVGFAQQLPQYSQYMHNQYVVNPAAAGMNDYLDVNLSFRQQWSGVTDAPRTYYLSATGALGKGSKPESRSLSIPISKPELLTKDLGTGKRKLKHALGGIVMADEYGVFNRTFVNLGYALHIPIGKTYYASVGASLGWSGMTFDNSSITLENQNVDAVYNDFIANGNRANMFDLNLGVMFYNDNLFLGYGLYQIMQNQIKLGGGDSPAGLTDAKLSDHHYILAGYRIGLSEKLGITPSAMLKNQGPAPLSYDINLKVDYMRKYWLGVSYRNEDAIVAMLGVTIKDLIRVGYSYDYTMSQLNNSSNGSHEIVLGLMLFKK